MKKAILILVLGLGLVFSVNAETIKNHSHLIKPDTWIYFISFSSMGTTGTFISSDPDEGSEAWGGGATKLDASHFLDNEKHIKNYTFDTNEKLFKYKRNVGGKTREFIRISEKLNNLLFSKPIKESTKEIISKVENYKPKILKDLIDEYTENYELKEKLIAYFDEEKPKKQEPKKKTPDDDKVVEAAWGSGFFVSRSGHVITNYHVIEDCDIVKADYRGSGIELKTLAIDKMNDIAIVQGSIKPDKIYPVSNEDVSLLEEVIVAGYPLARKISSIVKTHKGVVTAVAGAGDNYSNFQTDATINQGNSGGPIINQKGNVVGMAVATWVEEGVQGVHFGVKSSTIKTFANANGLKFQPPNNRDLSNKELGELITNGTVFLECHLTIAKIKKMIAEANNRKAFYNEYK